jgi:chromosome segregation ATPase
LAQLQIKAGGPIEDLIKEINSLRDSDVNKLEAATEAFDRRTAEHDELVRRLNSAIAETQQGISNAQKLIAETLLPQKVMLEKTIADDTKQIQVNNEYIAAITAQRARDQEEFEQKIKNAKEANAAIDEALALLEGLSGDDEVSLVQIKSAQKKLKKVAEKLPKSGENAWIKALVAIASTEYANSGAVQRVIQLLNDVKANISDHVQAETEANAASIKAF